MGLGVGRQCVNAVVVGVLALAPMACDKKAGGAPAGDQSGDVATPECMGQAAGNL